jgi:hypothetical protein
MLDHVRDVRVTRGDAGALEPLVEHAPGWADERMALDVLAISGLLADQHHGSTAGAFAHHGLRCVGIQIACAAGVHGAAEVAQRRAVGYWRRRPVGHPDQGVPRR